ncbi:MAG: type I DNA topoisomerase [Calditrichaeota bacterium]|nr:MAG: type I DNA topoisomerase [Calditrichota bacterium]
MSRGNGKKLVVVESPAKAKTINKILGKDYEVAASVGHIIDLPKSKIGVEIEKGFKPQYNIIKGKNEVIKRLREAAGKASEVLIATDPDREGEAIAYHIADTIKKVNPNIHRIEFNEITRPAVLKALEHPRDIDMNRVNAQQARRVMDRLVGYMVSPVLWKTIYRGLSAGRVQSVALRLICEREREIESFRPVEYWSITAHLETPSQERFSARLVKIGDKTLDPEKFRIATEQEARQHYQKLQQETFTVSRIKKEKVQKKPPPPFITSTLQQDAARRFGMTTSRIMSTAQRLYEGIPIGDKGELGLITYMRTDSTRISNEALSKVREYVANTYGPDYLPDKPNIYKAKKGAQDAHEAIRPTYISPEFEPQKLKPYLTADQFKIYDLIWKRFVASQLKPAIAERMTIDISAGEYLFRASGETIIFRGFLQVYQPDGEQNSGGASPEGDETNTPENLPRKISQGDLLKLLDLILKQNFTKPPPRYTESTLVKLLDKLGIGRPSTYAQIISTLFQRKYVEKINRALVPTELGKIVNDLLVKHFPNIFNVKFTAQMESELDKIEQNQATYLDTMNGFYDPFKQTLDKVTSQVEDIRQALQQPTEETCDLCGRPMVVRWGRNGKFLACSGFPECKNTRPLEEDAPEVQTEETCEKCGSPMVVKRGRYGEFLACSRYPECKNTRPISTGVACPEEGCSGTIVQRQSRKGKIFYSCSEYPNCKFALWNRPSATPCPECGYPLMEEKTTRRDGFYLQCPKCKHKEVMEELS